MNQKPNCQMQDFLEYIKAKRMEQDNFDPYDYNSAVCIRYHINSTYSSYHDEVNILTLFNMYFSKRKH